MNFGRKIGGLAGEMSLQKGAALGNRPASQDGLNGVRFVNPDSSEIQRELSLFARNKCDGLQLASYLLKHFRQSGFAREHDERVQRLAAQLATCCSWLWFKQDPRRDRSRIYRADFCNHRVPCINCARRASFVMLRRSWSRIQLTRQQYPGVRAYSLTLTMPNTADLRGGCLLLRSSLVKLLNRGRKWSTGPFRHVLGIVSSFEVTRARDSEAWHPHLHCILLVAPGQRVDVSELRQEWCKLTGGRQIRIDPLRKQTDLLEAFKYTLKTTRIGDEGLSLGDRCLAYFLLLGMRLRECYGVFRGMSDDLQDNQGEEPEDIATWNDVFYRWAASGYRRVTSLRLE